MPAPRKRKTQRQKTPARSAAETPEWYVISDPEQLKLIANDLRMQVLSEFAKEELTAKQVAERLDEPPTKLYRHVNALAKHGLIVPTREEQKRGTIQKFYRAVARSFRVDQTCFSNDGIDEKSKSGLIFNLLNIISSEIAIASEQTDNDSVSAISGICSLPESEVVEFYEKLIKTFSPLVDEGDRTSKKRTKGTKDYRVSIIFHPVGEKKSSKKRSKKR